MYGQLETGKTIKPCDIISLALQVFLTVDKEAFKPYDKDEIIKHLTLQNICSDTAYISFFTEYILVPVGYAISYYSNPEVIAESKIGGIIPPEHLKYRTEMRNTLNSLLSLAYEVRRFLSQFNCSDVGLNYDW